MKSDVIAEVDRFAMQSTLGTRIVAGFVGTALDQSWPSVYRLAPIAACKPHSRHLPGYHLAHFERFGPYALCSLRFVALELSYSTSFVCSAIHDT